MFIVSDSIWKRFPGLTLVVAHADGLANNTYMPDLEYEFETVWREFPNGWSYDDPSAHPSIEAWREAFRNQMHISPGKFRSSIEALARRALAGGSPPMLNPIVNLYNMISLQLMVPVGGWDVAGMDGDLELRLTRSGERFQELGSDRSDGVVEDEVCYADSGALITRHFVWRQSEQAKVTPQTRELFLVAEILGGLDSSLAEQVQSAFSRELEAYFGVASETAILAEPQQRWDWK